MNNNLIIGGFSLIGTQLFLQIGVPNSVLSEGIIGYLIQNAPALAILIYFGYRKLNNEDSNLDWMKAQLTVEQKNHEEKIVEIYKLNEYIRKSDKENLEIMHMTNDVLNSITSNIKESNKLNVSFEIKITELRKFLDDKIK